MFFFVVRLEASLTYDMKSDSITGLQECGDPVKSAFADHAVMFMARGIARKWKQPMAYYSVRMV